MAGDESIGLDVKVQSPRGRLQDKYRSYRAFRERLRPDAECDEFDYTQLLLNIMFDIITWVDLRSHT